MCSVHVYLWSNKTFVIVTVTVPHSQHHSTHPMVCHIWYKTADRLASPIVFVHSFMKHPSHPFPNSSLAPNTILRTLWCAMIQDCRQVSQPHSICHSFMKHPSHSLLPLPQFLSRSQHHSTHPVVGHMIQDCRSVSQPHSFCHSFMKHPSHPLLPLPQFLSCSQHHSPHPIVCHMIQDCRSVSQPHSQLWLITLLIRFGTQDTLKPQ